jgi:hypothetical protein
MSGPNNLNLTPIEAIEQIIEKLQVELVRIVEKHQFNFQNYEVIAASTEVDHWLNIYQQRYMQEKDNRKS